MMPFVNYFRKKPDSISTAPKEIANLHLDRNLYAIAGDNHFTETERVDLIKQIITTAMHDQTPATYWALERHVAEVAVRDKIFDVYFNTMKPWHIKAYQRYGLFPEEGIIFTACVSMSPDYISKRYPRFESVVQ